MDASSFSIFGMEKNYNNMSNGQLTGEMQVRVPDFYSVLYIADPCDPGEVAA